MIIIQNSVFLFHVNKMEQIIYILRNIIIVQIELYLPLKYTFKVHVYIE